MARIAPGALEIDGYVRDSPRAYVVSLRRFPTRFHDLVSDVYQFSS